MPFIPDKPRMIVRRTCRSLARKPFDAVEQDDLAIEGRAVAEQTGAALAGIEIDSQQHGDDRHQFERVNDELAGELSLIPVGRIRADAIDARVGQRHPRQLV